MCFILNAFIDIYIFLSDFVKTLVSYESPTFEGKISFKYPLIHEKKVPKFIKTNLNRVFITETISIKIGEIIDRTWNTKRCNLVYWTYQIYEMLLH